MAIVDWSAAIGYAQLVNIAYSVDPHGSYDAGAIGNIGKAGYQFIDAIYGSDLATDVDPHLGDTVTYGFLARSDAGELVAAIRGTEGIFEWIHDAAFLLVPDPIDAGGGLTEDGFKTIYESLRVGRADDAQTPIQAMEAQVQAGGVASIVVAGHSLGAALATLLGLAVGMAFGQKSGVKDRAVYTFASPRVGNSLFRYTYDAVMPQTYRIHNRPDIVPKLPMLLYRHVGMGLELNPPFLSLEWTLICWHSLDTYLWLMDRASGGNTLAVDRDCRGLRYPGPQ